MDRVQRLDTFWSWLPAFRAVGETEHLRAAAAALNTSPSALSRSIRLLEARLGCQLFHRHSRAMRLTPAGKSFLLSVRTVMRQLDDAVEALNPRDPAGPLRVVSVSAVTMELVAPAVQALTRKFPQIRPQLTTRIADVTQRLLAGEVDVAFLHEPTAAPDLHCELIANLPRSIYCSPDHPLATLHDLPLELLAKHAFVAPPPDDKGIVQDGWPLDWQRQIALETDQLRIGSEFCKHYGVLAVLPDLLGAKAGSRLQRLPVRGCAPLALFAVRRSGTNTANRAEFRLVAEVKSLVRRMPTADS
jgi:DNA-binding transcriptional LysR family regulator